MQLKKTYWGVLFALLIPCSGVFAQTINSDPPFKNYTQFKVEGGTEITIDAGPIGQTWHLDVEFTDEDIRGFFDWLANLFGGDGGEDGGENPGPGNEEGTAGEDGGETGDGNNDSPNGTGDTGEGAGSPGNGDTGDGDASESKADNPIDLLDKHVEVTDVLFKDASMVIKTTENGINSFSTNKRLYVPPALLRKAGIRGPRYIPAGEYVRKGNALILPMKKKQ